jgi:hypothetical protein
MSETVVIGSANNTPAEGWGANEFTPAAEVNPLSPEELKREREVAIMKELERAWEQDHGPMDVPLSEARIKANQEDARRKGEEWDGRTKEMTEEAREFFYDFDGYGENSVPAQARQILMERFPEYDTREYRTVQELLDSLPAGQVIEIPSISSELAAEMSADITEPAVESSSDSEPSQPSRRPLNEEDIARQVAQAPDTVVDKDQAYEEATRTHRQRTMAVWMGKAAVGARQRYEEHSDKKYGNVLTRTKLKGQDLRDERKYATTQNRLNREAREAEDRIGKTYKKSEELKKPFINRPAQAPSVSRRQESRATSRGTRIAQTSESFNNTSEAALKAAADNERWELWKNRQKLRMAAKRAQMQNAGVGMHNARVELHNTRTRHTRERSESRTQHAYARNNARNSKY